MTQPTNHRAEAERYVSQTDPDVDDIVGLGILHGILALHDLLERQFADDEPEGASVELDEDDPDTLAGDDTVEQPSFGHAYIPDNAAGYEPREEPADRVRLSGFAAIHRHDDFGPPWGAA